MSPIGCLFGALIALFGVVFVIALTIFNKAKFFLYNMFPGWKKDNGNKQQSYSNDKSDKANYSSKSSNSSTGNKVFGDDEGEYVDFEEIK